MSQRNVFFLLGSLVVVAGLGLSACESDNIPAPGVAPEGPMTATCEGCHTNQEMLIATAVPDEPIEDPGEG